MNEAVNQDSRKKVGLIRWLWRIVAAVFAITVVGLALAIGLFRVALPLLPDYQQRIEEAATRAIGYPLELGEIDARWRLAGPELVFKDVAVLSKDRIDTLLQARKGTVVIDFYALIGNREIRPSSVTLEGIQLRVTRYEDNKYSLEDLPLSRQDGPRDPFEYNWIVPSGDFALNNVTLHLESEIEGERDVTIPDIDIGINVDGNRIRLEGDLQLPDVTSRRVEFSLGADGHVNAPKELVWHGFIEGNSVDFSGVGALFPRQLPFFADGSGSFSLWFAARGNSVTEASATLDLPEIYLSDTVDSFGEVITTDEQRIYRQLAGRFVWEAADKFWRLYGEDLQIKSDAGDWPGQRFSISSDQTAQDQQIAFSLDYLSLTELAPILDIAYERTEEGAWRDFWLTHRPSGELANAEGSVTVSDSGISDYGINAKLSNIAMLGSDTIPAVSGLNASISGALSRGTASIDSDSLIMSAPWILRQPIANATLAAQFAWTFENDSLQLNVSDFTAATPYLEVAGDLSFSRANSAAPLAAEMQLTLDGLDLTEAARYYPHNKIKPKLLGWLDNVFSAGTGNDGEFFLKGPLNKFPYADSADGEFKAALTLNDATMNYAKDWPEAQSLDARVVFERDGLQVNVKSAEIFSVAMQDISVGMPKLSVPEIVLEGSIDADLQELRGLLDASPLTRNWGQTWNDFQMTGASASTLNLELNIKDAQQTRYAMTVLPDNAIVSYRGWTQQLTQLSGQLRISNEGINGDALTGMFLGQPISLVVFPADDYATRPASNVQAEGIARSELLGQYLHPELARWSEGTAAWTANMTVRHASAEPAAVDEPFVVTLQSPLEGMAVTLPAPLDKNSESARFLNAELIHHSDTALETNIEYGTNTHARSLLAFDQGRWKVTRGELQFGGSAQMPTSEEVRVVGSIESMDVSAILDMLDEYDGDEPWVELDEAQLQVDSLLGFGQDFTAANLSLLRNEDHWAMSVVGERANGTARIPFDITPATPVVGDFQMLKWAISEDRTPPDPQDAVSMKINANSFELGDYQLGEMSLHIEALQNIVALREFATKGNGFSTRTTGSWSFGAAEPNTYIVSDLQSTDVRATLDSLKIAGFLDAGNAEVQMKVSWPGGLNADFLQSMEGELTLNIGQGQLNSVDPGAGRVFGLLSIGALPRRLSLDFRDVFGTGFGFDSIAGDFTLKDGSATTENLALLGPAANVGIVGRTGLVAKDYDQTALVYANFGSSLPIAGAIAGGPAVGAALLVFSEIFKSPLRQMGRVSYSITGSWDDPQIEKTSAYQPLDEEQSGADETGAESEVSSELPAESPEQ